MADTFNALIASAVYLLPANVMVTKIVQMVPMNMVVHVYVPRNSHVSLLINVWMSHEFVMACRIALTKAMKAIVPVHHTNIHVWVADVLIEPIYVMEYVIVSKAMTKHIPIVLVSLAFRISSILSILCS